MKALRQVVIAARDLEVVERELASVLGLKIAFRDPGVGFFGLANAVMPVGNTFLEVVSPLRSDVTASRFLERRAGDAGYMLLVQTDDLAGDRQRCAELGVREVWSVELDDIAAVHLHPGDTGGAILSLDQPSPQESWRWAGPDWQSAIQREVVEAAIGAELAARDPAALAERWGRILNCAVTSSAAVHTIELRGSRLRFVPVREHGAEGLVAFEFRARDAERALAEARRLGISVETAPGALAVFVIGGVRLRLLPA